MAKLERLTRNTRKTIGQGSVGVSRKPSFEQRGDTCALSMSTADGKGFDLTLNAAEVRHVVEFLNEWLNSA